MHQKRHSFTHISGPYSIREHGDGGEEEFPSDRKRPPTEPGLWRGGDCIPFKDV